MHPMSDLLVLCVVEYTRVLFALVSLKHTHTHARANTHTLTIHHRYTLIIHHTHTIHHRHTHTHTRISTHKHTDTYSIYTLHNHKCINRCIHKQTYQHTDCTYKDIHTHACVSICPYVPTHTNTCRKEKFNTLNSFIGNV